MLGVMTSRQRDGSVPTSRMGALAVPALDRELDRVHPHRGAPVPAPKDRPGDRAAPGGRPPGVPFAKVRQQIEERSRRRRLILGFFRVISEFLKMQHQKE